MVFLHSYINLLSAGPARVAPREVFPRLPRRLGIWIFVLLLLPWPVFTTPAQAEILSPQERDYLREKKTLIFVSQSEYPPFEFVGADGDHTGMCIELVRWMATELGFKAHFTDTSFNKAQEAVLNGRADVITSLFFSNIRDKDFDFTNALFQVPASIFVIADRPDIKGMSDLRGKRIAMQKGDYALEFLEQQHLSFEVVYTGSFAEATDLVIAGEADAIIGDEQIVLYHVYSRGLADRIKKIGDPLYIGQDCMAVKDSNPVLVGILNKGILRARETGTIDRINRTWLGDRLPEAKTRTLDYLPYLIAGAVGVIFIVLLVWAWNIRLRRLVDLRTRELSKSEKKFRTMLAALPIGIGLVANGRMDWHNQAMTRITGFEPEEMSGLSLRVLYPDAEGFKRDVAEVMSALALKTSAQTETRWIRKDGRFFYCLLRYAPLNPQNDDSGAIFLAEDITERKRVEEALKESEAKYRLLVDNAPVGIVLIDRAGRILEVNRCLLDILGSPSAEATKSINMLTYPPLVDSGISGIVKACMEEKRPMLAEAPYTSKWGKKNHLRHMLTPLIDQDGRVYGCQSVVEDITDRKEAEEEIQRALREKEVLLREIHHRVKNNMAVIISLLSLQASYVPEEAVKAVLVDSRDRIRSMALIHETLYRADSLAEIDLGDYARDLGRTLVQAMKGTGNQVEMAYEIDNISLSIDQAVPCGLVLNELLTNALKYAFPVESTDCTVVITARINDANEIELSVKDNGVGIPENVDLKNSGTLGMRLISLLVENQLEGHWEVTCSQGTCITVSWPLPESQSISPDKA